MLPAASTAAVVSTAPLTRLTIGERLPDAIKVRDQDGQMRPLLSYKAALDILAVVYLTADCPPSSDWTRLRRYYDRYKEWRVAFVVVNARADESGPALKARLAQEKLGELRVAIDETGALRRALDPPGAPFIVLFDEIGALRFRGPLGPVTLQEYTVRAPDRRDAERALDVLIGHIEPISVPEPGGVPACPAR